MMKEITQKWSFILLAGALLYMVGCAQEEVVIEDEEETEPVGHVYLEENFEGMIWGGDYIRQLPGVKGEFVRDEDNKFIIDETKPVAECAINIDGSPDFFDTVSETYRTLRGLNGWDGWKVYERPGYLKMATGTSRDAFISTPPLSEIQEETVNLDVSADLAIWGQSSETIFINVVGGGTPSVNQLSVTNTRSWETYEFKISNATPNTRIEFRSDPDFVARFFISKIVVTKAD